MKTNIYKGKNEIKIIQLKIFSLFFFLSTENLHPFILIMLKVIYNFNINNYINPIYIYHSISMIVNFVSKILKFISLTICKQSLFSKTKKLPFVDSLSRI